MKVTTTNWRSWICSFEGHAKNLEGIVLGMVVTTTQTAPTLDDFTWVNQPSRHNLLPGTPSNNSPVRFFVNFQNFYALWLTVKIIFGEKWSKWEFLLGFLRAPWHIGTASQRHRSQKQLKCTLHSHSVSFKKWHTDARTLVWIGKVEIWHVHCNGQISHICVCVISHCTAWFLRKKSLFVDKFFHQLIGHETAFLALFSLLVLVFHSPCLLAPWLVSRCHTNALSSLWIVLSIIVWQTIIHQNPRMTLLQKMMLPNKLLPLPGLPQRQMTLQMCSLDHLQNSWHSLCEKSNSNWIPPCLHRMSPRRCHWIMPCQWWMHNCLLLL